MRTSVAAVLFATALGLTSIACARDDNGWLVGLWTQTVDEDGKPFDDTVEFRSDGTSIHYDATCQRRFHTTYHFHDGKIYVTAEAKKGFISLLFAPTSDHKQLVFTSPRTGNNAYYVRSAAGTSCVPATIQDSIQGD
jgi:hypothetical protein